MLRQDYTLRAIEQLGLALARILGLRRNSQLEEALREVDAAKSRLPVVPKMVDQLSATSLVKVLEDPQLVRNVAQLLHLEAEISYALGDAPRAVRALARSKALLASVGPATE